MKILLTGANGFVGSHILDSLQARGIATAIVLRPDSNRRLIESHLPHVTVRTGSLNDPESLGAAMQDVTHVIHCAGCTKALRASEFYEVNQTGTRHVVEAVNRQSERIQRLVHISSLAAGGPASQARPAARRRPTPPRLGLRPEQARRRRGSAKGLQAGLRDSATPGRVRPARHRLPAPFQSGPECMFCRVLAAVGSN